MDVSVIARLANLPVTPEEKKELAAGFTKVISVLDSLHKSKIAGVEPTHQVTGLENVTREDQIDPTRVFTQEEALANAKRTHNGYFVADQVLANET